MLGAAGGAEILARGAVARFGALDRASGGAGGRNGGRGGGGVEDQNFMRVICIGAQVTCERVTRMRIDRKYCAVVCVDLPRVFRACSAKQRC